MTTKPQPIRKDLPAIPVDSRLLQSRNTNVKGRVPVEIRNRTTKQTEKLNKNFMTKGLEIKHRLFDQYALRMEESNIERQRLNHYWRMKTKDSPYRYDQNEVELRHAESLHEKKKSREARKKRLMKVKGMTGEPFMDFYTDKLKQTLGTQEKLAMEHFRLLEQLKVVKDEQDTLEDWLHQDCDEVETKFAAVALQLAAKRQMERSSNSMASWDLVSKPKISGARAREIKEKDDRLYQAEGRWNESGQFVPVRTEQDKVGLMSAEFALVTGNKASKNHVTKKKDYGSLVEV